MKQTALFRVAFMSMLLFWNPMLAVAQTALWDSNNTMSMTTGFLDSYTNECLVCHEYDTGSDVLRVSNGISSGSGLSALSGHPVGMQYEDVANGTSTRSRRYTPLYALNEAIILPDGKVSCISCHEVNDINLDPENHGKLVVSNRGSQLCMECHNF